MTLLQDLAAVLPRLGDADVYRFSVFLDKYHEHLPTISSALYERLDAEDRQRFIIWFLKRWAKIDVIDRAELARYNRVIEQVKSEHMAPVEFNGTTYFVRDLASQGADFTLLGYEWVVGVHDVYYNQYEHKDVTLAPGDVIIDAGAFIGDTAVMFRHKLAGQCEIHSFELLDENIALIHENVRRNPVPDESGRVVVNKLALADVSGRDVVIATGRTQSAGSMFGADAEGIHVPTISLDDYVAQHNLSRVDFIKMDIEGAEVAALEGARRTIETFTPKMAICLYHLWDDPITIPQFFQSLNADYAVSFKWVQLTDGWEAVLFARPATDADRVLVAAESAVPARASNHLPAALLTMARAYVRTYKKAAPRKP